MPCYDSRDDPQYIRAENKKVINELTRLLCSMCRAYDDGANMPLDVKKWWVRHKRVDAEREAEQLRLQEERRQRDLARNKLTRRERELLGIK